MSSTTALSSKEAEVALEDQEVVAFGQAALAEAKEIQGACLAAGVPVLLGRDNHCTKGCSPKVFLLGKPDDLPRLMQVMRARWASMVVNDGSIDPSRIGVGIEAGDGEEPPCPACGVADPLVDGACPGCGLQLG